MKGTETIASASCEGILSGEKAFCDHSERNKTEE